MEGGQWVYCYVLLSISVTMPMMRTMSDKWKRVVASGEKEEGEQYEMNTIEIRHETKVNTKFEL